MLKTAVLAALCCVVLSVNAEARQRHKTYAAHPDCNVLWPCEGVSPSPRGARIVKAMGGLGSAQKVYTPRAETKRSQNITRNITVASYGSPSPHLARLVSGIIGPLAAKVSEIQAACGSKVVSGVRHTNIAGTRRLSLHASGKAVDMTGNPGCIYSMLHGWAGGYSTDYARVRHVHLSYDPDGGREMGLRFVHGGHRTRHAHRRHHRYAAR